MGTHEGLKAWGLGVLKVWSIICGGVVMWAVCAGPAFAQRCLHGTGETPEQNERRRAALTATRTINNIQANHGPERARGVYVRHADLANTPYAQGLQSSMNPVIGRMSLVPGTDVLPGWRLTLSVSEGGYWFMIKDSTDPCGFAFISNQDGLIYTAEPIR